MKSEWLLALHEEMKKDYYKKLLQFLEEEYKNHTIFPPKAKVFRAFNKTPLDRVKVVILGQDPYHEIGQAEGLSFSVPEGVRLPPSLRNIYKELEEDVGFLPPLSGSLEKWAEEGILLLNTVLTVRKGEAYSHRGRGWEEFTDAVIQILNKEERPIVFILWGKPAGEKAKMLNNPRHLILRAPHPSPFSAHTGFFGCKHFSKTNAFLKENSLEEIDWQL